MATPWPTPHTQYPLHYLSKYAEGSSMRYTSQGLPRARAMATRCSSPPDKNCTSWSMIGSIFIGFMTSLTNCGCTYLLSEEKQKGKGRTFIAGKERNARRGFVRQMTMRTKVKQYPPFLSQALSNPTRWILTRRGCACAAGSGRALRTWAKSSVACRKC